MRDIYDYKANAGLVIEQKRRGPRNVDTGEAHSLAGRVEAGMMGSRVVRTNAVKPGRSNKRETQELAQHSIKTNQKSVVGESYIGLYRPKTKETQAVFQQLVSFIRTYIGDQPHEIIIGAADEVLATIKDREMTNSLKRVECQKLLGKRLVEESFARLLRICDQINDFEVAELNDEDEKMQDEDDLGVAVVFNDEDDDDDDDADEQNVQEDVSGSSDSEEEEEEDDENIRDVIEKQSQKGLSPHDIDAYWIQRELRKYYTDANVAKSMAAKVLQILEESDARACENQLVMLLEFDKFDLIKLLLANRKVIMYCTRLKLVQTPQEKEAIEEEMEKDTGENGGYEILAALRNPSVDNNAGVNRNDHGSRRTKKEKKLGDVEGKIPKRIDLDNLIFGSGDHTMTNKEVKLPKGAWRKHHKGFEEVHIPPLKPRPFDSDEKLIPVPDMPKFTHAAFAKMKSLNRIQSRIYKTALKEDYNLLVCAPTGAGKTNVAVLTVMHQVSKFVMENGIVDTEKMKQEMKIVYIAPMKALVQEVVVNFRQRLSAGYGINVRELSGDQQLTRAEIADTQIIVTTPEKWDVVTRKSGQRAYTQLVRLMIIDEIHLLHNERGAVLEAVVARTIRQQEVTQQRVRIVGISATLPNFQDVATFLRVPFDKGLFFFDNSFRPVPLQQQYIGLMEKKPIKRFQKSNEVCYDKITSAFRRNKEDQILVFVHSRKETAMTARAIIEFASEKDEANLFVNEAKPETKEILQTEVEEKVHLAELKEILPHGLGIHHAGMARGDRILVENLFRQGYIKVLVCTATLAWGVNLPAHSVIIKGTQVYSAEKGTWTELSQLDILQMLGRAGRPQYDTEGEGIIITTHSELQYYLSLMNEQLPIESQLIRRLADSMNAEIVAGTIQNIQSATKWVGYTYLYVRMLKNPQQYGISIDEREDDKTLAQRRIDLVHTAALLLDKAQLIRYDRRTGSFQMTPLGRIAAHYYVSYDSMQTFNELLKPSMSDIELFRLFSLSKEFESIVVRNEEKLELVQLADRAPIPIKESLEEPSAKVNVLLQSYISGLRLEGYALACDLVYVHQSANRIVRALFEICLAKGWARVAMLCLDLANMCEHRIWPAQSFLRQLKGSPISHTVLKKLERHNLSVDQFFELSPHELGGLCNGGVKEGRVLHKTIHCFPKLDVSAHVQPISRSTLKVELTITPDFEFDAQYYGDSIGFWIIMEDGDGESILHSEMFALNARNVQSEYMTNFMVTLSEPLAPQYFCKVVCDRYLHASTSLPISFRKLILPERYPPHTALLDLQLIPTLEENDAVFKKVFASRFREFNSIQTQAFAALTRTDENVLIAAPAGSGKAVCAELAIVCALKSGGKSVYVSPLKGICDQRVTEWGLLFGSIGKKVVLLTGETNTDLSLLNSGDVIISTSEAWDNLSRRWKQRKGVRGISLFVADQLHLVGSTPGPILEVVVSRMRFMSDATKSTRIVGLGCSLANGKDIAGWIGAKHIFSFHPSSRPSRIEMELRGFDSGHFGTRILAMARPTFDVVSKMAQDSKSKKAIIFVPSKRQAKLTSIDLITFAATLGREKQLAAEGNIFVDNPKLLAQKASGVTNATLKQTMELGVAFLESSLSVADMNVVKDCYQSGIIRILVVVSDLCWGLPLLADLVVVMGTTRYDGVAGGYVDYPVTDIMHMSGRSRNFDDSTSECVIFCHSKRRAYYKKFLHDPLPVESHLDQVLADPLCAEVVAGVIKNKQDAVDYLTWTLLYRRLTKNPNYYNLLGTSNHIISDYMSELIENTLNELSESKCIEIDDNDMDVSALNLGMVASYYYIQHTTIEVFATNLRSSSKIRRILDVLSSATEFDQVPVQYHEERVLKSLAAHVPLKLSEPDFSEASTKTNILLQMHFSRKDMSPEQRSDLKKILVNALTFMQAIVDIISSNGWLAPALAAMELSQMIVQARWSTDSPLLQIPHFDQGLVERCNHNGVKRVFDIMDLDDDKRNEIIPFSDAKMTDVANFCNTYPDIEMKYNVIDAESLKTGEPVQVEISLDRLDDDEGEDEEQDKVYGKVSAPLFPNPKFEQYWLVIGDPDTNSLLSIKRVLLKKHAKVTLEFDAPKNVGKNKLKLYFMCDSVMGVDEVHTIEMVLAQGSNDDSSSSDDDSSDSD